jgi:hypothetical protein
MFSFGAQRDHEAALLILVIPAIAKGKEIVWHGVAGQCASRLWA